MLCPEVPGLVLLLTGDSVQEWMSIAIPGRHAGACPTKLMSTYTIFCFFLRTVWVMSEVSRLKAVSLPRTVTSAVPPLVPVV